MTCVTIFWSDTLIESHLNGQVIALASEASKQEKLGLAQLSLTNGGLDVEQTALRQTMLAEDFSQMPALDDQIAAARLQDTNHHVGETLLEPVGPRIVTESVKVEDAKSLNSGGRGRYRWVLEIAPDSTTARRVAAPVTIRLAGSRGGSQSVPPLFRSLT